MLMLMGSFQNLVAFIFLFTVLMLCQHSPATRFLLKDTERDELVVGRGSPSKAEPNMQGSEGKMHAEMSHCEEGRIGHHEGEGEGCHNFVSREFEDGDYIYTNSAP